jgi:hypothetical protein
LRIAILSSEIIKLTMTLIRIPRPPRNSYGPSRPLNSNIRAQLRQFQDVEASLPPKFRTDIYVNAIETEHEAGVYIREMTETLLRMRGLLPSPQKAQADDLVVRRSDLVPSKEEWDVFISHAGEDKDAIAAPLARALVAKGLRVWYDEFSLTLGDSLRESIDHGLAHSRFGAVILSSHFFQKHWPQRELNGLATREVNGKKVILPVWHGIGFTEVRDYSPILADRLAVQTKDGLPHVVKKIVEAVTKE